MKNTLWFICACVWILTAPAFAEEKITFLPINPVPEIEKQDEAAKYTIEHDINEAEASGMVQRIAENLIVVNNKTYLLASGVAFYSAEREPLARKDFEVGNIVGWQLNGKGEISKLWKLADDPQG